MSESKRNRGKYFIVRSNGKCESFDSKTALVRALGDSGTDGVAHVFRGHKLEIETKKIDRITIK